MKIFVEWYCDIRSCDKDNRFLGKIDWSVLNYSCIRLIEVLS